MKRKDTILFLLLALSLAFAPRLRAADPRHLPAPDTVSPEMAASVAAEGFPLWLRQPKTIDEWHALLKGPRENGGKSAALLAAQLGVSVSEEKVAGVTVRMLTPKAVDANKRDKLIYFIHGGGYVIGAGMSGTSEGILMAALCGYRVAAVDYRLAPDFPYPAAIDDSLAVYRALAEKYGARDIAVLGTSTGGGMTLVLALQALEAGVPLPAALIAGTPWSDLQKRGDSYFANEGLDNVLNTYDGLLKAAVKAYANGADLADPRLSPVYADDAALAKFPPTLLVSGTRDLFLSNTVRMHKRLLLSGADAELIVYEAQSHAQYYLNPAAPETAEHYRLLDMFLDRHLLKKK